MAVSLSKSTLHSTLTALLNKRSTASHSVSCTSSTFQYTLEVIKLPVDLPKNPILVIHFEHSVRQPKTSSVRAVLIRVLA